MKISVMMEYIEYYLINHPHLRDDDNKLVASIWKTELSRSGNLKELSALFVLQKLADGEISNPQTITRARRKLQETRPQLQGLKYKERMIKEAEIRSTIAK